MILNKNKLDNIDQLRALNSDQWIKTLNFPERMVIYLISFLNRADEIFFFEGKNYIGYVRNGKKHGQGQLKYENGDFFEGKWENDQRTGYGICTYADGTKYQGFWQFDSYHGEGTLK